MRFRINKWTFSLDLPRQRKVQPGHIHAGRFQHVCLGFYTIFAVLVTRAVIIHIFPGRSASLENIAESQYQREIELAPYRGTIYDRREIPLAISIRTPSIAVNPKVFRPTPIEMTKLSQLMGVSQAAIFRVSKKGGYFAWVKRKVPRKVADQILALNIKGLHQIMEPARYYPDGGVAANLIGAVGLENRGLFGLEATLDSTLRGTENKVIQAKDARGNAIFLNSSMALPEQSGNNIYLTLDQVIQEITQDALAKAVKKADAKGGFALVSDPHTGRILAMANYPTFDPNATARLRIADTRNQSIGNVFEPGSIMKPFVIARAIESGVTSFDSVHNCEKSGRYKIGPKNWIHDDHPKESLTTGGILVHSSNICTVKVAQRLGPKSLFDAFKEFGFSPAKAMLGLAGEARGRLDSWQEWRPIRFATVAFGQGIVATGLEIVRAYGVIANGGNLVDPYIVDRIETERREIIKAPRQIRNSQVIRPETARRLREILAEVVTSGTAKLAATDSFTTGGKTGTAQKVDPATKTYSKTKRTASMAGFAPVEDPHVVVFVVVDEPGKTPYYGGIWAAPAFAEIVDRSLKYLNVAHDKVGPTISGVPSDEHKLDHL